jgi:signal transduction histidine kinase
MRRLAATVLPVTLLLLIAALRVAELTTARAEVLRAAETRATNLAQITSSYLGETFGSVDAALRQLVIHARRVGGPDAPSADWLPTLAAARAGNSIGAISITDRDGTIRHSTQPLIVGQSRRDEATVRALMNATDDVPIAGPPFPTVNPAAGMPRFIIPMGRKLVDANGRTTGTVVASMVPDRAKPFLRSLDVGRRGTVRVFHPDGVLLYEEPSTVDRTGERMPDNPLFAAARGNATGALRAPIDPDGTVKLTAYVTRVDPPLITAVSLDESEVLAAWTRQARRSAVAFPVLAILLTAVLIALARGMRARSAALAREEAARREAEAANAVKDQFLMTLSHELRTPLAAISGWARMLAVHDVDETQRDRAIQAIERNARAQQRLVDDLLDISRVVAGKLPLDVRPVEIADVARQALETVRPAAEMKGIRLRSLIQADAGTVSGDPERLQQVVWNLLSNAVKFTPSDGDVLLDVERVGDTHVRIAVADTGDGISPAFLPRVFERFAQQDASTTRAHGGLGLGLAIVRNLVELHGGTVGVRSEGLGHGATFEVMLPTRPAGVVDEPRAAARVST